MMIDNHKWDNTPMHIHNFDHQNGSFGMFWKVPSHVIPGLARGRDEVFRAARCWGPSGHSILVSGISIMCLPHIG